MAHRNNTNKYWYIRHTDPVLAHCNWKGMYYVYIVISGGTSITVCHLQNQPTAMYGIHQKHRQKAPLSYLENGLYKQLLVEPHIRICCNHTFFNIWLRNGYWTEPVYTRYQGRSNWYDWLEGNFQYFMFNSHAKWCCWCNCDIIFLLNMKQLLRQLLHHVITCSAYQTYLIFKSSNIAIL